jgi:hypothetical protein
VAESASVFSTTRNSLVNRVASMNRRLCSYLALIFAVSSLVYAQSEAPYTPPDIQRTTVSAVARDNAEGLIKLDVAVRDATGKPVADLKRADFNLVEEGRDQNIISFQAFDGRGAGAEPPVKVVLLIDTLQLPADLARDERLAVESYLRSNGGHLAHPVEVFELNEIGLWAVTRPSNDGNVLAREAERDDFALIRHNVGWQLGSMRGAATLKDPASLSALKALGEIATDERKMPGRKLLLWIGPGWGIGSGAYDEAKPGSSGWELFGAVWWFSTLLREARLELCSFTVGEIDPKGQIYKAYLHGVRNPHKASFMNVYRKVLAVQSGGLVLDNGFDLAQQIKNCIQDAGPYYRISFDPFPADHPNEYHDLRVVINQPGLTSRTNTGFYDQPYYSIDQIPQPKRVSIEQLDQLLTASPGESDAKLAKQVSELALTERLSGPRLASLSAKVHSRRVEEELTILADSSAFLNPPAGEIPSEAPPDIQTQQHVLSLTAAYLRTTIHKLPDFLAKQTTVRYQETPMYLEGGTSIDYRPLHISDSWSTTVRYHNGFEVVETKAPKRKPKEPQLVTYGVFGTRS